MTNALRRRDGRNQLPAVVSLMGVAQTQIASSRRSSFRSLMSYLLRKVYAAIVYRPLEELVEPCGFPHFYLLATAGSARLKGEGSPSPNVMSSLSY